MRYIFTFFLFLQLITGGFAQQVSEVNFTAIEQTIADSSSPYYYPKLVARLLKQDTTMSRSCFHHLYYGAVFQPDYHPYGATPARKKFFHAYAKRALPLLGIGKIGL